MKYNKIVDLPTGVKTKISSSLEGNITVEANIEDRFKKPIKNTFLVSWWEFINVDDEDLFHKEIKATSELDAERILKTSNRLARGIKVKPIN